MTHLTAQRVDSSAATTKGPNLYPSISAPRAHPLSKTDIHAQRRAYIDLSVDFLISAFPIPEAVQQPPASGEVPLEPTTATARAYSLLVSSILPAASYAVGAVVNTVSSSSLWQRAFGGAQGDENAADAFEKLVGSEGPIRGFAWRVCCLLKEMEICYGAFCWGKPYIFIGGVD